MKPTNSLDAEKICFLVFSDDWGEHPSSCQHIFKHIAKQHKVLWVNTIGMRNPTFTLRDLKKIVIKVGKMAFHGKEKAKGAECCPVAVCQPPMLPFSNLPFIRRINRFLVTRAVHKRLQQLDFSRPVLVTTVPNAADFIGHFDEQRVVYYCVDDFSEWPGLEKSLVLEMEKDLVDKADIFIATSQKLYDRLVKSGKPTTLLSHGVDVEHFRNLPKEEHPLLVNIPKPRIGYFGLFDERSDQDLLAAVAEKLPKVSFVITGNVATNISKLKKIHNIYFTGPVPYKTLPEIVTGWIACILPYKVHKMTDSISPLKLKEYIATGKPTISTPINESYLLKKYIYVHKNTKCWVYFIKKILKNSKKVYVGSEFYFFESWEFKSKKFLEIIGKEKILEESC